MNKAEHKKISEMLLNSSSDDCSPEILQGYKDESDDWYDFSDDFNGKVFSAIAADKDVYSAEYDFTRSLSSVFMRIALSGAAAIILLLISLYLSEGDLSLRSIVGISDSYNDGIVYLLTGN
jgi:hypothetical protein